MKTIGRLRSLAYTAPSGDLAPSASDARVDPTPTVTISWGLSNPYFFRSIPTSPATTDFILPWDNLLTMPSTALKSARASIGASNRHSSLLFFASAQRGGPRGREVSLVAINFSGSCRADRTSAIHGRRVTRQSGTFWLPGDARVCRRRSGSWSGSICLYGLALMLVPDRVNGLTDGGFS